MLKFVDIIVIAVIALIIGLVVFYIHKAKKKGIKCIGCPNGATCSGHCGSCPGSCSGNCASCGTKK